MHKAIFRAALAAAMLSGAAPSLADPSCETVYWGKAVADAAGRALMMGAERLPLAGEPPSPGEIVAAMGADRRDPEALAHCEERYAVVRPPRLAAIRPDDGFGPLPRRFGKSSAMPDWIALHDPDGVLWLDAAEDPRSATVPTVSVFLNTELGLTPLASRRLDSAPRLADDLIAVAPFDELYAYFGEGLGLVFLIRLPGAPILVEEMRWSVH